METVKLNTYEQYRKILGQRKLYNNGFSKSEIIKYIKSERAFVISDGSTVVFAYDEQKYWQMIIPIDINIKQLSDIVKDFDRPIVCYVIAYILQERNHFENLLVKAGFRKHKTIREYILDNFHELESTQMITPLNILSTQNIGEILTLWSDNLPIIEVPLLSKEDIENYQKKGQLFYFKHNNCIIAACCYDAFLGKVTVNHVVVSAYHRGKGLATQLIYECLINAKNRGMRSARAWIEEDNVASQKSFETIGFYATSKVSNLYIFNKKEKIKWKN